MSKLPKWKSSQEVGAFKIERIYPDRSGKHKNQMTVMEGGGHKALVESPFMTLLQPSVGDYYIVDELGDDSILSEALFEGRYKKAKKKAKKKAEVKTKKDKE